MKFLLLSLIASLVFISRFTDVSAQVDWPKIYSLDWHPSTSILAYSLNENRCRNDGSHTIYLKDISQTNPATTIGIFDCPVTESQWNSIGTQLLSIDLLGNAVILDTTGSDSMPIYNPSYTMSYRAQDAWSPDNLRVANISATMSTINVWDAQTGEHIDSIEANHPNYLDWTSDSQGIVYGGASVVWIDAQTHEILRTFRGNTRGISVVTWNDYASQMIAAGDGDGNIYIYNANSSLPVRHWKGHDDMIFRMIWNPDGRTLATTSDDGTLKIWNTQTGEMLESYDEGRVMGLDWSPDGTQLAYGGQSNNGDITIVEPELAPRVSTPDDQ